VLGDPGRWICSGMSGGVVFLRHAPERGLDEHGLRDRFAKGAKVNMRVPLDSDVALLAELLGAYVETLTESGQEEAAREARRLLDDPVSHFRVVRPGADIVEQTISTE